MKNPFNIKNINKLIIMFTVLNVLFTAQLLKAGSSIGERRMQLLNYSYVISANFNEWQRVRNEILKYKNKIEAHRNQMKECLIKLNEKFDDSYYKKCAYDNYSFSYLLGTMPRTSSMFKFPKQDFSGGKIYQGTLELVFKLHKWIEYGKKNVEFFERIASNIYKNNGYNELTNRLNNAMTKAVRDSYCVPMAVDNFELATTGLNTRMANQQFVGDIVGMNLVLAEQESLYLQISKAIEFCGDLQSKRFLDAKEKINNSIILIKQKIATVPLSDRLSRFCFKMPYYKDPEVEQLCSQYCNGNVCDQQLDYTVINKIHNLVNKNVFKKVEAQK